MLTSNFDIGYATIMGIALTVGTWLSRKYHAPLGLTSQQRWFVLGGAFCGAMFAAKLPFVLTDWAGFLDGTAWFQNGKTIICGLAGGYFGVETAKWSLDIRTRTGDSFVVPVAVTVAIGRVGCFHAGCCYGTPTELPWGTMFATADTLRRHPTQLYETIFHLMMAITFAVILHLRDAQHRAPEAAVPRSTAIQPRSHRLAETLLTGHLFKLYIITYAAYRFVTEMIRPEARIWGRLTGYQWASLALIAVFATIWYRDLQHTSESHNDRAGGSLAAHVDNGP